MSYEQIAQRLKDGGIVILDGGTGTELERRGVPMSAEAWCGPTTLEHADVLVQIHRDYIDAGSDIITANTYASSRLMLKPAGYADRFGEINRVAIDAAHRARKASGREDTLVAGSLSQMYPMVAGSDRTDQSRLPTPQEAADAFGELCQLHREEGCDMILLEMMYHPDRMPLAFEAATASGLPVWAGFSVRRGSDDAVLGFGTDRDVAFADMVGLASRFDVDAAGVMHSPSDIVADAIGILKKVYDGRLLAYPDSGYFKMPDWQFENIIAPDELRIFAEGWIADGVQILGGCCGLSPEHIAALAPLRERRKETQER